MKITIEIDCKSAAFSDVDIGLNYDEVRRVLQRAAGRVPDLVDEHESILSKTEEPLLDSNGNTCGFVRIDS